MKYAIFSDIDGTLYPESKEIHPHNEQMIKHAQSRGIEFLFATGNGYFSNIKDLGKKFNCSYLISSNGAAIIDVAKNEHIYQNRLPQKIAQKILDLANKFKVSCDWWDDKYIYHNNYAKEEVLNIIKRTMAHQDNEIKLSNSIEGDIYKIEFLDQSDKIDKMVELLKEYDLEMARVSPSGLEITNKNVSKAQAIKWFLTKKQITPQNTMAIGDSANDLAMLKIVNHSYAMANAPIEVKNNSKHHTSSVEQGGLGEAIIDFIYREKIN